MAEHGISMGQRVAVVWDSFSSPEALQIFVQNIQAVVGTEGCVSVENLNQLLQSFHKESSFDVVLSGLAPGSSTVHSAEVLAEIARIAKPGGRILLREVVTTATDNNSKLKHLSKLHSALTLSGLVEVKEVEKNNLTAEQKQSVKEQLGIECDDLLSVQMEGKKPNFEVGSSSQLRCSFVKKPALSGFQTLRKTFASPKNPENFTLVKVRAGGGGDVSILPKHTTIPC